VSDMLKIRAHDDLRALGKALRESGQKHLRPGVFKAIQTATKPLKAEISRSAEATLPGGLGDLVADLKIVTQSRLVGRSVGVRIVSSRSKAQHQAARRRAVARRLGTKRAPKGTKVRAGLIDLPSLDRGRARHPTYGHRPWKIQQVRPGFFTRPMTGIAAVRARRLIVQAVQDTNRLIAAAGKRAA
jgi:hypothetical protein